MFFLPLLFILCFPTVFCLETICADRQGGTNIASLKLGLPANTSALVTGLLPVDWHCEDGTHTNTNFTGRGFFTVDYTWRRDFAFALTHKGTYVPGSYSLYYGEKHQTDFAILRICKFHFNSFELPGTPTANDGCLVDTIVNNTHHVVGFTASGNTVRLHLPDGVSTVYVPGASDWSVVLVRCHYIGSCAFSIVQDPVTVNVTTSGGIIQQYDVCQNCSGFADNIFAVEQGGFIPSDFAFNNWFMLTNASSLIEGVTRASQPLLLRCLWPIPGLQSTTGFVHFNDSASVSCNGFVNPGFADALRFNLNFSSSSEENLRSGQIIFKTSYGLTTFYCTNDTVGSSGAYVPFGVMPNAYYCFINSSVLNGTYKHTFIGAMPVTVREFVVSRYGHFYINGYRYFSLGPIEAVNFNFTTSVATDFWTVAFVDYTEVLVNISGTSIQNVLYCDTDINKIRCDHLAFYLGDGFYSASSIFKPVLPETFVTLPTYHQHSEVHLHFDFDQRPDHCWTCYPSFVNITLLGTNLNDSMLCVETSHFTTYYHEDFTSKFLGSWSGYMEDGNCPFSFLKLNNFLQFGSICFSTKVIPGGCAMPIIATWGRVNFYTVGSLYVSWTDGDRVTGVPTKVEGVNSFVNLTLGECTKYNIYGESGTGIIREAKDSFIAGIKYTSISGNLLGFKDVVNGTIYSITPCNPPDQVVVHQQSIIGAMMAENVTRYGFSNVVELPNFYYRSNGTGNCTVPVLTYSSFGICADGTIIHVQPVNVSDNGISAIVTANISVPANWTTSIQVEYLQISHTPVSVDCATYVCNGNVRCNELLLQYTSACKTIEDALRVRARLESSAVSSMLTYDSNAFKLANISSFGDYNLSSVLPRLDGNSKVVGRSAIEDVLFNKVVTSGLGTVDTDYKKCTKGLSIADLACAQYYNGIMVLPGVADAERMAMYTGSLIGGMALGGLTSAAAVPFSLALQARLNYVALQTDVLQENQKILAASFNKAMSNIVEAFTGVNEALTQTSQAIKTVATALNKIQDVVNQQGKSLNHLTAQLRQNFQAISSSIQAIYDRLDTIQADQQVDRLITGRLAALNAFVSQTLVKYSEVRASRLLAQQKVNECVKSQSNRFGFCGNGTHIFSIVNAAPQGLIFLHTVLQPTAYVDLQAWSGMCLDGDGFVLRQANLALYKQDGHFRITSRVMFEPRVPTMADFVQIENCNVTFLNISRSELHTIVPEYVDVNKTLQDLVAKLPNYTVPNLGVDQYNQTILNLTGEIGVLEAKSLELNNTVLRLQGLIDNINSTLVDLKWLNRVETYIKWPWWVWLIIVVSLIFVVSLLLFCCLSTGCCGCCSCLTSSMRGCCDCGSTKLPYYEFEKVHVQ
uniref:Spike protein n=1 Tax=Triaenops bat coronavirus TaxID=2913388 RepID=A0AB38ZDU7_9NIDO